MNYFLRSLAHHQQLHCLRIFSFSVEIDHFWCVVAAKRPSFWHKNIWKHRKRGTNFSHTHTRAHTVCVLNCTSQIPDLDPPAVTRACHPARSRRANVSKISNRETNGGWKTASPSNHHSLVSWGDTRADFKEINIPSLFSLLRFELNCQDFNHLQRFLYIFQTFCEIFHLTKHSKAW